MANPPASSKLGLGSGVGLVAADMIGAGVLLSAGFMAFSMGPKEILLDWVLGAVLALAGARAYASVADLVPRSGGEYRYLSELAHPALGYLAGWGSLLVGFSAPVAIQAYAAGSFAGRVHGGLDPRWLATAIIVLMTAAHAIGFRISKGTQNVLVIFKIAVLVGFVVVGLVLGSWAWPHWESVAAGAARASGQAPPGFSLGLFLQQQFWIAFAFSGWNAAVYAAEDFRYPRRDVPRAMLIGCALVAILYLVVNWIFVANLTPAQATSIVPNRVTLAHLVMANLAGETSAKVLSGLLVLYFVSAVSAMMFIGPRVYAAMARDGFLPRALAGREGETPVGSVILQGALALVILHTQKILTALDNVGAVLVIFSALTVGTLFVVALRRRAIVPVTSLAAAAVYLGTSALILYYGFKLKFRTMLPWVGAVAAAALVAYFATAATRRRMEASAPPRGARDG